MEYEQLELASHNDQDEEFKEGHLVARAVAKNQVAEMSTKTFAAMKATAGKGTST